MSHFIFLVSSTIIYFVISRRLFQCDTSSSHRRFLSLVPYVPVCPARQCSLSERAVFFVTYVSVNGQAVCLLASAWRILSFVDPPESCSRWYVLPFYFRFIVVANYRFVFFL